MKFFALAGLMVVASAASAQTFFTGALTANDPTWNRPVEGGTSLSGAGTSVFYDVQPFYVAASGTFTFESASTTPSAYDTFIFIYKTSFNAGTPLVNYVAGDDDFTGAFTVLPGPYSIPAAGTGTSGAAPASQILAASLITGVQYYAINTSFTNAATGTYYSGIKGQTITGGPADVVLGTLPVPEPATMVALGMGAVALLRRRKKA